MLARDLMTRDPSVIMPDATVQSAAALMEESDTGFVPVVADLRTMRLVGVVTDRDIAVRCVGHHFAPSWAVGKCMTADPIATVAPDTEVHEVLGVMAGARVRRVPVVDAARRLVGVISQADLARRLHPSEPAAIDALVRCLASFHDGGSAPAPRQATSDTSSDNGGR